MIKRSDNSVAEKALQWTLQIHREQRRLKNIWKYTGRKKCGLQVSGGKWMSIHSSMETTGLTTTVH